MSDSPSTFAERLQAFWHGRRDPWLALWTLPLSWLFAALAGLRRAAFACGLLRRERLPAPVVVVGNIHVGGAGKTPLTLALLAELLTENDEVAVFTAWDNKEYYHYKPQMSSLYARILSTANNKMVQVASVVRESSRDYPRPVALEIFEYPPFLFEADALQQCLRDMAESPEYADIKFTESSVGTVYLYSTRYLDEDYAAFLAENEDVGAIASP